MNITNKKLHSEICNLKKELKSDIREIKLKLLDPEDGLVVRINKNTNFRKKAGFGIGAIFTAVVGIVIKLLFDR